MTMTDTYPEVPGPDPAYLFSTQDLITPPDRDFWLYDEMFRKDEKTGMPIPSFPVKVVAQVFFGQNSDWLRWRMRPDAPSKKDGTQKYPEGYFVLDGEPLEFKRRPGVADETTARYFTLADIERMAHALGQQGLIDGGKLAHIILMVRTCARLYGAL